MGKHMRHNVRREKCVNRSAVDGKEGGGRAGDGGGGGGAERGHVRSGGRSCGRGWARGAHCLGLGSFEREHMIRYPRDHIYIRRRLNQKGRHRRVDDTNAAVAAEREGRGGGAVGGRRTI